MGKPRRSFTLSEKQKAVADYQAGKKTAKQIAAEFNSSDNNLVHRWKYELETRNQGQRVEPPKGNGQAVDAAKRIRELEAEVLEYQKIVAEQAVILDLLKTPNTEELSVREKIQWIDRHYQRIGSKKKAAEVIGLTMSSYYYDPKIPRSEKEEWDADLRGKIEQIRITHPKTGYRTLLHYLKRGGIIVSEYKLRKVMKQFSLGIKPKRRYVRTTNSQHGFVVYPNLVKNFNLTKINQVWVSDITYIRIENGFVYLAVILDLFSRRVIGYSISKKLMAS